MRSRLAAGIATSLAATGLAGCFDVRSADLFQLTRTGVGRTLRLQVSDGGTVRCNGEPPRALGDRMLVDARQLADDLDADARHGLNLPPAPGSVYRYTVRLQNGTVRFADTAAIHHRVLASTEQLTLQIARQACAPGG